MFSHKDSQFWQARVDYAGDYGMYDFIDTLFIMESDRTVFILPMFSEGDWTVEMALMSSVERRPTTNSHLIIKIYVSFLLGGHKVFTGILLLRKEFAL